MRIAYINPQPIPGLLPSTIQALQVAESFAGTGHEVTVLTPRPEGELAAREVLGHELDSRLRFHHAPSLRKRWFLPYAGHRLFYRYAARWLRDNPMDAVYVRNLKLAEVLLRTHPALPLFFETHELFAQSFVESGIELGWRNRRKLDALGRREALVYRGAKRVLALTQALADDIRERYPDCAPIIVAPDGVDLQAAELALRAPPPCNPRPVLLYLGSLHRWKGVEVAIDALPALPAVELRIVGGSDARVAELSERARRLGVAERAVFVGQIPPASRFDAIQQADICLLPLIDTSIGARYTSPLKLFEYMAMGKPIVASDLVSVREVLAHRANGMLVAPGDAAGIADAVQSLLAAPDFAQAIARRAREDAARFAWSVRAEKIMAALGESAPTRP